MALKRIKLTNGTYVDIKDADAYVKPSGGIPASDLASGVIPTVPTISTDISSDATSDTKTTSPKAVKTFVEGKGYGTYSKPSGGIPKTDLASAVQDQLVWEKGSNIRSAKIGNNITVSGNSAVAFGTNNDNGLISSGAGSLAHGDVEAGIIQATGAGSYAGGYNDGTDEDIRIEAIGDGAHAEGCVNGGEGIKASGDGSHAEGYTDDASISATNSGSHAEGYAEVHSNGLGSHAEGAYTVADGDASHAEGNGTIAQNDSEHAEGKYNKSNTHATESSKQTLHSVGCGDSTTRKNAFEIMQNGDVYVKGVGGYDGTNAGAASTRKVQDVLPNNTEHIYVVCRACNGTYGSMSRVSTQGGVVHFKLWNPATCEEKEESYAIPSNGVVEAYIPFGMVYQVHSTLSGYGASFRPVFTASNANGGTKYVHLWNLPTGVYKMAGAAFCADDGISYRVSPLISTDGSQDWLEGDEEWDSGNGDAYDYEVSGLSDDHLEDAFDLGIVVSTANVSVLIQTSARSDSTLAWSFQGYGRTIPGLEEYFESHGHNYEDAQYFATYDYDGNLNTFKILDFLVEAPAVEFASQNKSYTISNWYLPSAGELKTLYNNRSAYNAIQSDYSDVPALDNNWYWSSCAYSPNISWRVRMGNGDVSRYYRYDDYTSVLAVSAFLFKY